MFDNALLVLDAAEADRPDEQDLAADFIQLELRNNMTFVIGGILSSRKVQEQMILWRIHHRKNSVQKEEPASAKMSKKNNSFKKKAEKQSKPEAKEHNMNQDSSVKKLNKRESASSGKVPEVAELVVELAAVTMTQRRAQTMRGRSGNNTNITSDLIISVDKIGDTKYFGEVGYSANAIANVLSYSDIAQRYEIQWDQIQMVFIVHVSDKKKFVFKYKRGSYVFKYKRRSYVCNVQQCNQVLVTTVEDNMKAYSKRELRDAARAKELMKRLGYATHKILEPDVASLKGKTSSTKSQYGDIVYHEVNDANNVIRDVDDNHHDEVIEEHVQEKINHDAIDMNNDLDMIDDINHDDELPAEHHDTVEVVPIVNDDDVVHKDPPIQTRYNLRDRSKSRKIQDDQYDYGKRTKHNGLNLTVSTALEKLGSKAAWSIADELIQMYGNLYF
eukprot:gene2315-4507_t